MTNTNAVERFLHAAIVDSLNYENIISSLK